MEWLSNEVLFYGGLGLAVCSALAAFIFFCLFRIGSVRLNAKLDAEYGEKKKSVKNSRK